jgi:hypothetical protein
MADYLEGIPGVFTFVMVGPRFRQIAQKCIEGDGGAGEKRHCLLQVMLHRAPDFTSSVLGAQKSGVYRLIVSALAA